VVRLEGLNFQQVGFRGGDLLAVTDAHIEMVGCRLRGALAGAASDPTLVAPLATATVFT
jgi:hypothetical protein